jgi:hypothetical protein
MMIPTVRPMGSSLSLGEGDSQKSFDLFDIDA